MAGAHTFQIARDGEGAETLIEVLVGGARDRAQAKPDAKPIVNSPLVKTAVRGAKPHWARVAMAVGKCQDDTDIDQERVVIRFGDCEVYPTTGGEAELAQLAQYLRGDEVRILVTLGTGRPSALCGAAISPPATSGSTSTTRVDRFSRPNDAGRARPFVDEAIVDIVLASLRERRGESVGERGGPPSPSR